MKYRTFGKLDWEPSALGFGAMRLPYSGDDRSKIVESEAINMMRYAFDHGVNYVDTAYPYHEGKSEAVVGKALKGYREKVKLATKLPTWLTKEYDDFDTYFSEQLKRLDTDYIDFYLLHALNEEKWPTMIDLNVFKWAEEKIDEGKIKYLGFSFHDSYEIFTQIVDYYDWTFCQIQYNYMDTDYQAGTKGLKYAADKGLAVVVMEPIRGGQLGMEPPEPIKKIWDSAQQKRTPADWALQWVWNQPEVSLLLSGMTTMQHVKENVVSAGVSGINTLKDAELDLIAKVKEKYSELCPIPCTQCKYCMPCPNDVRIPRIFEIYNEGIMYNKKEMAQRKYRWVEDEQKATACIECGECMEACPQNIDIPDWLQKAHKYLTEK
jgi:predicted aldo/keto reductase-like oxidoreductase